MAKHVHAGGEKGPQRKTQPDVEIMLGPLPEQLDSSTAKKRPSLKYALRHRRGMAVGECADGCFEELSSKTNPWNAGVVRAAGAALRAMHELHKERHKLKTGRDIPLHRRIDYADAVIIGRNLDQIKDDLLRVEVPENHPRRIELEEHKRNLAGFNLDGRTRRSPVDLLGDSLKASHRTGLKVPTREDLLGNPGLSWEERHIVEAEWHFTNFDNNLARERIIQLVVEAAVLSRAYKNMDAASPIINHFLATSERSVTRDLKEGVFERAWHAVK